MDAKDNILDVTGLTVSFDGQEVISDINFSVKKGDVFAVLGPNGAGKSVLFRALVGLVAYKGAVVWKKDIKVNYVPQRLSIEKDFPIDVGEFMAIRAGKNSAVISKALELTGLDGNFILDKKLASLSGGQFQRVMIAWSILNDPDVILFDEPMTGIDVGGEETIYNLLYKLNKTRGTTILIISHDLGMVFKYSTSVLCLNKTMFCLGHPHEVITEENMAHIYGHLTSAHDHNHSHHGNN
ncbi:MAG: metal ABC transporter ATP-binding protein [Candidatus Paceibacterota bacterium]|jgi:zinc transport system ATP-binding protein